MESVHPESGIDIVITGFGSFDGCPDNPSSSIARAAEEGLLALNLGGRVCIHSDVEVSLSAAQTLVTEIHAAAALALAPPQAASTSPRPRRRTVIIHIGVASLLNEAHLEARAVNDASFRVADVLGQRPQGGRFIEADAWRACRRSRLDIPALAHRCRSAGHAAAASLDAGTFLCNAIFYQTLAASKETTLSLFLHIPRFSIMPLEKAVALLIDLAAFIASDVAEGRVAPEAAGVEEAQAVGDAPVSSSLEGPGDKSGGSGGTSAVTVTATITAAATAAATAATLLTQSLIDLGFETSDIAETVILLGSDATIEAANDYICSAGESESLRGPRPTPTPAPIPTPTPTTTFDSRTVERAIVAAPLYHA